MSEPPQPPHQSQLPQRNTSVPRPPRRRDASARLPRETQPAHPTPTSTPASEQPLPDHAPLSLSGSLTHDDAHDLQEVPADGHLAQRSDVATTPISSDEARELYLSHALAEAAIANLDLDTLLPALLDPIKDVMRLENVAILLCTENGEGLLVRAASGLEEEAVGKVIVPIGKGFAGRIAASRRPLVVPDLAAFDAVNPLLRERICSATGVPLLVGDHLLGVLHIGDGQPREFTAHELTTLQHVADHVALAIDRALLYQAERDARRDAERQTERTSHALNALLGLAGAIVSAPIIAGDTGDSGEISDTPDETSDDQPAERAGFVDSLESADEELRHLASLCSQVLGCERIAIIAVAPESERLRPITVSGSSRRQERAFRASFADRLLADRFSDDIVGRLKAGESVLLDLGDLPPDHPARILSQRHFLLAPLRSLGQLTGYIGVNFGDNASDYTPDNRALTQATAQLVGLVMERQRLAHEREEARADALSSERARRQMDVFLSIAGHELRTPITSAKVNVQIVARMLERLLDAQESSDSSTTARDARTVQQVQRAQAILLHTDRQFMRQQRLINDLLETSRIETGKLDIHVADCDLTDVVRESVEEQQAAHPERAISLSVPHHPLPVRADADQLIQVTDNLLTNALKYSPPDAPISVRVRLDHTEGQGSFARCEVQDHGPGLAPEEQERVWQRFYRVTGLNPHEGSGLGLGLGLYISKTIVERHGGQIGVESAPGEGSTFWFTLPLAAPHMKLPDDATDAGAGAPGIP